MDLASMFDDVVRIGQYAEDADSGWASLVGYLEDHAGEPLQQLATVDLLRDVREVRSQIQELLQTEPPPPGLNAVYFGLFDMVGDDGGEVVGYYLAGVKGFDREDGDSLCSPVSWPKGRYLASAALDAIKEAEISSAAAGKDDLHALLGYAGQLGGALLISKFAS